MLLPKKIGVFTAVRRHDVDPESESFVAILDEPAARRVVARRVWDALASDPVARAELRTRVGGLRGPRHPSLARVLDLVEADGEVYVLEAWRDGVPLGEVIRYCRNHGRTLPPDLLLHLAVQLCDALDELHGVVGRQGEAVLHLGVCPAAIRVTPDGDVTVGRYGLFAGPADRGEGALYLAPELTRGGLPTPSADVFGLGAVLYELATLERPRWTDGELQPVEAGLARVRKGTPGLDRVLVRALSANPRHRYPRAFMMREALRALMVGRSPSDIAAVARDFLAPVALASYEWYVSGALPAPVPSDPDDVETRQHDVPWLEGGSAALFDPQDATETSWYSAPLPVDVPEGLPERRPIVPVEETTAAPRAIGPLRTSDALGAEWVDQDTVRGIRVARPAAEAERSQTLELTDSLRVTDKVVYASGPVDELTAGTEPRWEGSTSTELELPEDDAPGRFRVEDVSLPAPLNLAASAPTLEPVSVPIPPPPRPRSTGRVLAALVLVLWTMTASCLGVPGLGLLWWAVGL